MPASRSSATPRRSRRRSSSSTTPRPTARATLVRRDWPAVQVIDAGGNLGFARANNLGIRATAQRLVLLLNPDTVVAAGRDPDRWCAACAPIPDAAIAGPAARRRPTAAPSCRSAPPISPWDEFKAETARPRLYERGIRRVVPHVERLTAQAGDVRLGQRRLPAGPARRPRGRRAARRALLHVHRGRRLSARRSARAAGTVLFVPDAEVLHLRGRSAATAIRQLPSGCGARATSRSTASTIPAWAPLLAW